jgi:hypothetical protein
VAALLGERCRVGSGRRFTLNSRLLSVPGALALIQATYGPAAAALVADDGPRQSAVSSEITVEYDAAVKCKSAATAISRNPCHTSLFLAVHMVTTTYFDPAAIPGFDARKTKCLHSVIA